MAFSITSLTETPIQETEEINPVTEDLKRVLEATTTEKGYIPDRRRQEKILNSFSERTVQEMDAFLRSAEIRHEKIQKDKPESLRSPFIELDALAGYLMEESVKLDPAFEQQNELSSTLLSVIQAPERFNLHKVFGLERNPDFAYVHMTDEGQIVINELGEAKMAGGGLDARALEQLKETGSQATIQELINFLNTKYNEDKFLEDLRTKYGLHMVADLRGKRRDVAPLFVKSPDFRQTIILPANKDPSNRDALIPYRMDSGNVRDDEVSNQNKTELRNILQEKITINGTDQVYRVGIKTSAFSAKEYSNMAVYFKGQVEQLRQKGLRFGIPKKHREQAKEGSLATLADKEKKLPESGVVNAGVVDAVRKSLVVKLTGNEDQDYMKEAGIDSANETTLLQVWLMDAQNVKDIFWGISGRIASELNKDGRLKDANEILSHFLNKEIDEARNLVDPTLVKAERIVMAQNRPDEEKVEELGDLYRLQTAKTMFELLHPKVES